jgi:prolyl oligopeptidase
MQHDEDPYLWLEEIEGERALEWVKAHNALTRERYESRQIFQEIYRTSLDILNSEEKLAYPSILGQQVYNFWRDAQHERGLLRRASQTSYLSGRPEWETVLSVDELAEAEGENWVYKGHQPLPPDYSRSLVWLSRGGSDAAVLREFDLVGKRFVPDGFELPEAKSDVAWRDRDTLYVGTDFGPGSMTDSGYPRLLKVWRRGTPLEQARPLFEASSKDLAVGVFVVRNDPMGDHDFLTRVLDFWNDEKYLIGQDLTLTRLDLPSDAPIQAVWRGQLVVALRSDWRRPEATYRKGSVLSLELSRLAQGIEQPARVLFNPDLERGSVESVHASAAGLLVTLNRDVQTRLYRYTLDEHGWQGQVVPLGENGSSSLVSCSRSRSSFFLTHEDFLHPTTLYHSASDGSLARLQSLPARFEAEGLQARQHWVQSKDGSEIPYTVIGPRELPTDGSAPTLLYGYGGFEVSLLPSYLSLAGPAWLARGGVYVSANIRGGGEFGPAWHQAALRENRPRAYEDFEAVAEDLIRRGITSPTRLGVHGRSNGGLLTGAMLTRRPDLFGAVLIGVPLLDMRRYHKLLAGASWMAEYGDPDNPQDWEFLKTYSPYHNLDPAANYPVPLIFTSTRDDRVHPGHARKMAARLEELGFEVIYYENLEGGHAGASNNPQTAFFTALNYAYLWERLGGNP